MAHASHVWPIKLKSFTKSCYHVGGLALAFNPSDCWLQSVICTPLLHLMVSKPLGPPPLLKKRSNSYCVEVVSLKKRALTCKARVYILVLVEMVHLDIRDLFVLKIFLIVYKMENITLGYPQCCYCQIWYDGEFGFGVKYSNSSTM
jgi:hypothetical protein